MFVINAIIDKIHSMNIIALPTATAAFADQLYPGEQMMHLTFKVRFVSQNLNKISEFPKKILVKDINEMLESPTEQADSRGKLIRNTAIIMQDEALMANKAVLTCVYKTCQNIMNCDKLFGNYLIQFFMAPFQYMDFNTTD